jgi:hypothetical protein
MKRLLILMEELSHANWKGSFAARGKIRQRGKRTAAVGERSSAGTRARSRLVRNSAG